MQTPPPEGDRVSHEICKNIPPLGLPNSPKNSVLHWGSELSVACIDAWRGGDDN